MSILVLALNPSIDAEWRVDDVLWEEKNDVHSERRWAGGKGINVARWLKYLGAPAQLLLPLGGRTGGELAGYLRGEKIPARILRLREATRVNAIVTTNAGRQMRFNAPGPKLSRAELAKLFATVEPHLRALARPAQKTGLGSPAAAPAVPSVLLVLSGSLPRGVPLTAYARLIRVAHRYGVRTVLDCDGPAFAAAVPARPFLVKPNEHELAQWWRQPLRSEAELVRAARALAEQTGGWVMVSRGAKRSLLLNPAENFQSFAPPPRAKPRNTVGAGDAMLAAVAQQIQRGTPPPEWLRGGLATGTAATKLRPGQLPGGD